ncbi:MAG: hypothetical protein AAB270_00820, partial [Chloroflexota bacterium]
SASPYSIGKQVGLHFVYVGIVPAHPGENTHCYSCGQLAGRRVGYNTDVVGLTPDLSGRCAHCGTGLNFKTPAWRRAIPSQAASLRYAQGKL